jgi:hypothetical protein
VAGTKRGWLASAVCLAGAVWLADGGVRAGVWVALAFLMPLLRRGAWSAVIAALVVLYLRYSGHGDFNFPAIDWIRPRGMDLWPGLLAVMGWVLVLSAGAAALARGRRTLMVLALLGVVLSSGWWVFPAHFNVDVVGAPSSAGMPVVVNGRIEHRSWRREVLPSTPMAGWNRVIRSENNLSDIAHGMQQVTHPEGGMLRATLWGIQRATNTLYMVWTAFVGVLVLLGLLAPWLGKHFAPIVWWAAQGIGVALWFPPLHNLLLRAVGVAGGLPEASIDLPLAMASAGATLVVFMLAQEAQQRWSG